MSRLVIRSVSVALATAFFLTGCGGGASPSPSTVDGDATFTLSGQVQKGPLIFGSRIWVAELDSELEPNGRTYLTQTVDDLGHFAVSSTIHTRLVELVGTGYYMDELTGSLSTSPVTLSGIADLRADNSPTINVLTTIQAPRLRALMLQNRKFDQAFIQSQSEVLAAFGVDSSRIQSLGSLYAMQVNGTTDQDAALLATSALLSKMASTAAVANGSSQAAELTYLLSRIASDIETSGRMTTASIIAARNVAGVQLDLAAIRTNVESYYASRGIVMAAPKFEEWVDKDGSGVLPRRLIPASGLAFAATPGAEPNQIVTSDTITVGGLGTGVAAAVSVNAGTTIVKNGIATSSLFSTVLDGDTLALQRTSRPFGQTTTATISVGSVSTSWTITSRVPTVVYGVFMNGYGSVFANTTAKYFAHPFIARTSGPVRYVGIGLASDTDGIAVGTASPLVSISVHLNGPTLDVPGAPIATSGTFGDFFNVSLADTQGVAHPANPSNISAGTSAYFGSGGVVLTQGQKYWVVATYQNIGRNDKAFVLPPVNGMDPSVAVDFARRLASTDGVAWSDWGCCYGFEAPWAMPLYMAD